MLSARFFKRPAQSLFSLILLLLLCSCGGGGGGDAAPAVPGPAPARGTPPVAVALPIAISSISPLQVEEGSKITVKGAGLTQVKKVMIGEVELPFRLISEQELELTFTRPAQSGPLLLMGSHQLVQSTQSIILPGPQIDDLSATELESGESLTLSGSLLNHIRSVRLDGVLLPKISQSATQYSVSIPASARSGFLTIESNHGASQTLPQMLRLWRAVAQPEFQPALGTPGQTISILGQGVEQVEQLLFSSNQAATIVSRSENRLEVLIPQKATSGPLTLVWGKRSMISSSRFSLAPLIEVSAISPLSGAGNSLLTIVGQGLDTVSSAKVGGVSARIMSKQAKQLILETPAEASGEVVLQGGEQAVRAGSFQLIKASSQPKATINLENIAVVQNYSQLVGEKYQRLVAGKATLVTVALTTQSKMLTSPRVWLYATMNGMAQGQPLEMFGPATIPNSVARGQLGQSFNAQLPEKWVRPGLALQVSVDPELKVSSGASRSVTPLVGQPTNLDLVLVPLQFDNDGNGNSIVSKLPDETALRQMLSRVFPLADSAINISIRNPYQVSSVKSIQDMKRLDSINTGSDAWNKVLTELNSLRSKEASGRHYYGLVPDPRFTGGTTGLGYVNQNHTAYSNNVAIGLDARYNRHLLTMAHELGHNMSRHHAPCGGVKNPDPSYPYPNGKLGNTLPYDPLSKLLLNDKIDADIMGYCSGEWFSDYNYSKVQSYLEQKNYALAPLAGFSQPLQMLMISGSISAAGLSFEPVSSYITSQYQQPARQGDYQLRIVLADGQSLSQPFTPTEVADAEEASAHFLLSLPQPQQPLQALEVWHKGKLLGRMQARAAAGARVGMQDAAKVQWVEQAGKLDLSWDAGKFAYLSVSHLGKTRQLLANSLSGGRASVVLGGVPAGGQFELSLSNGLNTSLLRIRR